MVKNALKILVISVTLVSCTINPTYKRKDIEKTIEKICKEEQFRGFSLKYDDKFIGDNEDITPIKTLSMN